jgi:hypothetical protein
MAVEEAGHGGYGKGGADNDEHRRSRWLLHRMLLLGGLVQERVQVP